MKQILMFVVCFALTTAVFAQSETNTRDFIEVRGNAVAQIEPDRINVSVMLSEADTKGKVAMLALEKMFSDALVSCNIDVSKQVVVVDQSSAADKKNGALLYKNYLVTLHDAQKVNALFIALNNNDIKNASVSRVWSTRQQEVTDSLKVEAAKNAQKTAQTLAIAIGQSIGKAIQIVDVNYYQPVNDDNFYRVRSTMAKSTADGMVNSDLPEVEFRKITVNQSITAKFLLK